MGGTSGNIADQKVITTRQGKTGNAVFPIGGAGKEAVTSNDRRNQQGKYLLGFATISEELGCETYGVMKHMETYQVLLLALPSSP